MGAFKSGGKTCAGGRHCSLYLQAVSEQGESFLPGDQLVDEPLSHLQFECNFISQCYFCKCKMLNYMFQHIFAIYILESLNDNISNEAHLESHFILSYISPVGTVYIFIGNSVHLKETVHGCTSLMPTEPTRRPQRKARSIGCKWTFYFSIN